MLPWIQAGVPSLGAPLLMWIAWPGSQQAELGNDSRGGPRRWRPGVISLGARLPLSVLGQVLSGARLARSSEMQGRTGGRTFSY